MRVLLVEDDSATSASIKMMLRKENFICDTTDLGEDGLEIGKLYDYDIILLDLMLPDIDGYEVLRRLRAARVHTPILILSGLAELDHKLKGLGFGADDFLTKPFDRRELVARIHAIVRRVQGSRRVGHPHRQAGRQSRRPRRRSRRPPAASDRQGIRHPRAAQPAQGHHPDQGDVSQSPLWRDGRAGAQNHRRLCLQVAQEARSSHRRKTLYRDGMGTGLRAARPARARRNAAPRPRRRARTTASHATTRPRLRAAVSIEDSRNRPGSAAALTRRQPRARARRPEK